MGTIKVMAFEPNRPSSVISLPNELEDLQDYVGGYLEPLDMGHDLIMLMNEDGKVRNMKWNRELAIVDQLGRHFVDVICGKFFICRKEDGELASVTDVDIARIKRWEQDGTLTMYRAHS